MVNTVERGLERLLGSNYLNEFASYDCPRRERRETKGKNEEELLGKIYSDIKHLANHRLKN